MRRTVGGFTVLAVAGAMLLSLALPAGASPGNKIDSFVMAGNGCGLTPPWATFQALDTSGRVRTLVVEVLTVDSAGLTSPAGLWWAQGKGTLSVYTPQVQIPSGYTGLVAHAFLYTTSGNPHQAESTLLDSQTIEFSCP